MVQISKALAYQTTTTRSGSNGSTEDVVDTRRLVVIDGVPFYHSTGGSEDRNEILSPAWRRGLWMPFSGADNSAKKAGHLCKLGSLFKASERNVFQAEILSLLRNVIQDDPDLSASLRALLLERYNVQAKDANYIDDPMILDALANQLTRFGTFEALFVSIRMAPLSWESHPLLAAFKIKIIEKMSGKSVLSSDDVLPSHIAGLEVEKTFEVNLAGQLNNQTDAVLPPEIEAAVNSVNQWLYTQVLQQRHTDKRISRHHISKKTKEHMAGLLSAPSAVCSEMDAIQNILCGRLEQEIESFKRRKGMVGDSNTDTLCHYDKLRFESICYLNAFIKRGGAGVMEDGVDRDGAAYSRHITTALSDERLRKGEWKRRFYLNLSVAIEERLDYRSPILKYSELDVLKIHLLNLLTALIFPVALIKKAVTGSFFFSTAGKTYEAVKDVRNQLDTLLPTTR